MDLIELQTVQNWLAKTAKQRENSRDYDEMVRLQNNIWSQWQDRFMHQDRDMEHPFKKGWIVRRQREKWPYGS